MITRFCILKFHPKWEIPKWAIGKTQKDTFILIFKFQGSPLEADILRGLPVFGHTQHENGEDRQNTRR